MTNYRSVPDHPDQQALFYEMLQYAFRAENGVPPYNPEKHETPRATLGARRGLYDAAAGDEELRCGCRHYWLTAAIRGDDHPIAGLASVATPPEYRRQGYVRQLLEASLAEYRDRGNLFSVLWPFRYRFYRQYGWDTANRIVTHECDPAVLAFARRSERSGSFRRLEADEYAALEPAYETHRDRYALALARDEEWWRHRIFGSDGRVDPFVYAYERDGRVAGYLVYTIEGELGDRTMEISEHAAVDPEALLALLSFVANHDSQVQSVSFRAPESFPLRELAADPDGIETTVENGPMVRIVDVAAALSELSYPDVSRSLTISVDDPLAEWNDGRFALEVADGSANCKRLESNSNAPDATLDAGALSQLVVGSRSAPALERTGRLEASAPDVTATLDDLFPKTEVYLGHFF